MPLIKTLALLQMQLYYFLTSYICIQNFLLNSI